MVEAVLTNLALKPCYTYMSAVFPPPQPPLNSTSQATPGQGSVTCFCDAAAQISTAMVDDGIFVTGAEGLSPKTHVIQIYPQPLTRGGENVITVASY